MMNVVPRIAALLALALASVGPVAAGEPTAGEPVRAAGDSAAVVVHDTTGTIAPADTAAPRRDRVVVHYFHPEFRCETCLTFEAYAAEALREAFPAEIADGRLEWRVVDIDRTESDELTVRYAITGSALVVSTILGDDEVSWIDLPEIWDKVADKRAFMDYVQANVSAGLDRGPWARRIPARPERSEEN